MAWSHHRGVWVQRVSTGFDCTTHTDLTYIELVFIQFISDWESVDKDTEWSLGDIWRKTNMLNDGGVGVAGQLLADGRPQGNAG